VHPQLSKPIQLSKSQGASLSSRPSHLELCFSAQYYTIKNRPVKFFEVDSSRFFMGGIGESTTRRKVAQCITQCYAVGWPKLFYRLFSHMSFLFTKIFLGFLQKPQALESQALNR
jgi:hypothetical protein